MRIDPDSRDTTAFVALCAPGIASGIPPETSILNVRRPTSYVKRIQGNQTGKVVTRLIAFFLWVAVILTACAFQARDICHLPFLYEFNFSIS